SKTTTSSSSSSSEIEYSAFSQPKQKPPRVTCFAHPPRPKPIKIRSIESTFIEYFGEENDEDFMKNRSKAASFYSNFKNFKQPISPGVRLTSFINSLFTKDGKNKKKNSSSITKLSKTEENAYSSCSSASSFSRSCMSKNNKKFQDDGVKQTVRFCPVSVIVDDDSQACGYRSLREEKAGNHDSLLSSSFGRSMSKRYEELRKLNGLERESEKLQQQKKLEEAALDLLWMTFCC
ncbi:Protein BIG GRAIN 1-like A, partial [Bienertia sinuspersici]